MSQQNCTTNTQFSFIRTTIPQRLSILTGGLYSMPFLQVYYDSSVFVFVYAVNVTSSGADVTGGRTAGH